MGKVYDSISGEQTRWIEEQPMFFVATAGADERVNVSPRGLDTSGCWDRTGWRGWTSPAAASRP